MDGNGHRDLRAGVTLIELVVVVAVAAILAAAAVPALGHLVLNARRAAAMEAVVRGAWFARGEAARRAAPVVLCPSADGAGCDSDAGAWASGWIVTAGAGALRQGEGPGDRRAVLKANRLEFVFRPHDRRSTNGTIAWCDERGERHAKAVVISPTGRPRLQAGAGSLGCGDGS
jgi:type IV fimbrial biogenesis protein FimT